MRYFEGTPIPTSVLIIGVLAVLYVLGLTGEHLWMGEWRPFGRALHPLSLLYVASGSAMISATLRIPKP